MDFLLLDNFTQDITDREKGTTARFCVISLYEINSHVLSKIYFLYSENTEEKLKDFFNNHAYNIVTNYVDYKMQKDGKLKLILRI